jgi:gamma-glutamylcyclotransferase (GGCT)/AIG2-like uncharacterized protein YtfP
VKYYFAYGMNTNIGEMTYRCPGAVCVGSGRIANYQLVFRTHADIERSEDGVIYGVVWKITDRCEQSLDVLEGYPYYYDKKEFVVELDRPHGDITHIIAMAYQMTDQSYYAPPNKRYLDCLMEGYVSHNVDTDQIHRALETVINEYEIRQ